MDEANKLLTRVFMTLTSRSSEVIGFRQVAALGLPHAEAALLRNHEVWANQFLTNPENDEFFKDKAGFLAQSGGAYGMAQALATKQVDEFRASVDSAAIVFMHAALDGATYDLCRVTAMIAPADWESAVERHKVALSDIKPDSFEAIRQRLVEQHVNDLERRSLIEKADRLLALCKPAREFVPVKGFAYDRDRLIEIDGLRHDIVHRGGSASGGDVDDMLERLLSSGLFLLGLVSHRYGVKMDPAYALNK